MSWLKSYADSALSAASHLTNDLLQANAARRSRDGDFDRGDYYVDSGPPGPHRNSDARDGERRDLFPIKFTDSAPQSTPARTWSRGTRIYNASSI